MYYSGIKKYLFRVTLTGRLSHWHLRRLYHNKNKPLPWQDNSHILAHTVAVYVLPGKINPFQHGGVCMRTIKTPRSNKCSQLVNEGAANELSMRSWRCNFTDSNKPSFALINRGHTRRLRYDRPKKCPTF